MPVKVEFPLQKVTLNLFEGDKDTLEAFFPAKGWSVAARELLNQVCVRLRESDSQEVLGNSDPLEIELPNLKDVEKI